MKEHIAGSHLYAEFHIRATKGCGHMTPIDLKICAN